MHKVVHISLKLYAPGGAYKYELYTPPGAYNFKLRVTWSINFLSYTLE